MPIDGSLGHRCKPGIVIVTHESRRQRVRVVHRAPRPVAGPSVPATRRAAIWRGRERRRTIIAIVTHEFPYSSAGTGVKVGLTPVRGETSRGSGRRRSGARVNAP